MAIDLHEKINLSFALFLVAVIRKPCADTAAYVSFVFVHITCINCFELK